MLAIQANKQGIPVVIESVHGENGKLSFQEVSAERWMEIVGQELDLSEVSRPIIPIEFADMRDRISDALKKMDEGGT
jgi:hypothetical protein